MRGVDHVERLAVWLEREVAARFPAHKSLEDFDFGHPRSIPRAAILHLGAIQQPLGSSPRAGNISGPVSTP